MPIQLSENARKVLEVRYFQRDGSGQIIETPRELFQRVARSVAKAEEQFGNSKATGQWEEDFLEMLVDLDFLPKSPRGRDVTRWDSSRSAAAHRRLARWPPAHNLCEWPAESHRFA